MKLGLPLLALEMEEGTRSQGMPLEAGIASKQGFFPVGPLERTNPADAFVTPVKPILDFSSPEL